MVAARRDGRTIFDDLVELAIGRGWIIFDDLVRLIIEKVGIGAFTRVGDRLLSNTCVLDEDIGSDDSPSLFFLASLVVSDHFLLDTIF